MDILRWGYYSRMQINETESIPVRWVKCQVGAQSPPFDHAFGSSRQLWMPQLPGPPVGEIYRHRVRGSDFAESSLPGTHVCGDQGFWQNGWAAGTPPLPVDDNGVPICCEGEGMGVEQVGLSLPNEFVVTGSPVFSSGILSGVWRNQQPNRFLMSPAFGAIGPLSVRGVVPADLGRGTADSSVFLRGDLTWAPVNPTPASIVGSVNSELSPMASLFGLYEWSPGQFSPAGTIFWTSVIGEPATEGPWVSGVGTWTRPPWWAPGTVFSEAVSVWFLAGKHGSIGGVASLLMISPETDIDGTTPWTVDTDAPPFRDYPVPGTSVQLPADTFVGPTGCPLGLVGTVTLQNQTANTVWAGPPSGAIAQPTWRALVVADLPTGYPYSELSGAPGAVSVAAGTNVSVSSTGGVYTVSVPTFPYSDLTGVPSAPSVAAGTNVSVGLFGSVYTVSVPSFPAALLSPGTVPSGVLVPAAQVGPGYNYADLSGAPPAGAAYSSGDQTTAVSGSAVTVLNLSATHAIIGDFEVSNLTAGTGTLHFSVTDPETGTHTGTFGIGNSGNWSGVIDLAAGIGAIVSGGRGPYTAITVQVTATSSGNVRCRWGAMLL